MSATTQDPIAATEAAEGLTLAEMAAAYNAAQEQLGRPERVQKFASRAIGLKRLDAARQELLAAAAPSEPVAEPVGARSPLLARRIASVVAANPKRPTSRTAVRFGLYRVGMTGAEFMAECLAADLGTRREVLSDLSWDSSQGFITFE